MQLSKLFKILFVVSLILLIISLNSKLYLFNFNLYKKEFIKFNIYKEISNADENALNLINFMNNKEELNDFYNEKEKLHLQDVKDLYKNLNVIFYLTLILTILFLMYFIYNKKYKIIYKLLLTSGSIILALTLLFFVLDFNYLFERFHVLAFENNLWQLNPEEDKLINLFPGQIQYNIAKRIFIGISISAFGLIVLSLLIKFKVNKRFLNNKNLQKEEQRG